jgi:hypothetical protein
LKIWDPETHDRFAKLEKAVGELTLLVDILLCRSGLDAAGIERAHEYAASVWKETVETMAKRASDQFLATPEGQNVHRQILADQRERQRQIWREDCVEAGRILPAPE